MTVEELNVKISADASAFRKELGEAETAISSLLEQARQAGKEITDSFSGLIKTQVTAPEGSQDTARTASVGSFSVGSAFSGAGTAGGYTPVSPPVQYGPFPEGSGGVYPGVISVKELTERFSAQQSLLSAAGSSQNGSAQPVNITTTVELDGDKIGESVNRYFMRRNTVTNGQE